MLVFSATLLPKDSMAFHPLWPWSDDSHNMDNAKIILELVEQKDGLLDIQTLWNHEAIESAKNKKEAFYIPLILEIFEKKINSFAQSNQRTGLDAEELNKQAYSLLFVMMSYFNLTPVAESAAVSAVRKLSLDSLVPDIRSYANRSSSGDLSVIIGVSLAARRASYVSALSETIDKAKTSFRAPVHSVIVEALSKAIDQGALINASEREKARIIYNLSYKVFLLSTLQNFDDFLEQSFKTAINGLSNKQGSESIFHTAEAWKGFKSQLGFNFISHLLGYLFSYDQKALEPWMPALDGLAANCAAAFPSSQFSNNN